MTAAERAARAAKIRAQRASQPQAEPDVAVDDPQVPASRAGYVRTDPVVQTVKLAPSRNAGLRAWCDERSVEFGRPPGRRGVTMQAVLDALVAELLVDETISRRVKARLAKEYGPQ